MTSPKPDDFLAIAHLVRPHGLVGEVSAIPLAPPVLEPSELFEGPLSIRSPKGEVRAVEVLSVRPHKERWLILLAGIESMDEAESLRDYDLCLPREALPALPEGWFWEEDLVRCRVLDRSLGDLGTVKGLNVGGAQPQLELRRPDGQIALIPWVRAFVNAVDLESGQIRVDLPPGFPGISASATRMEAEEELGEETREETEKKSE